MPSIRPVLLKHYGNDGFKFYTNYESKKGRDIVSALYFQFATVVTICISTIFNNFFRLKTQM